MNQSTASSGEIATRKGDAIARVEASSPLTRQEMTPRNVRHARAMKPLFLFLVLCLPATTLALSEWQTLVRFYNLAGGKSWRVNDGWKQAADGDDSQLPVCSWHGIKCNDGAKTDEDGVTHIELPGNQLSGKISKQVWSLPKLQYVNFRANEIRDGGFEGFETADPKAPVEQIVLSENKLTHMNGIGAAPKSLAELHISSNSFQGPFPEDVFELKKLKVLLATYNRGVTGPLPTAIGHMTNLKQLLLWYNSMTGSIPTEIGKLNKLESLGLDENKLSGSLPSEMNNMVNLRYFSCQNFEDDTGTLTGKLPSLENLVMLKDIYLDDNELTGSIPASFLKHSSSLDAPVTIGLMRNNITGAVPKELGQFQKLQLDIIGNKIDQIPKDLCKMNQWMAGTVEQFGCDAMLCPKGTYSDVGRQDSTERPCVPCANGEVGAPYLGTQKCKRGEAEAAVGSSMEDQQILVEFALATNWQKWSETKGWKKALSSVDSAQETESLELDFCNFHGVVCSQSKRVTELNLPKNGARGKIPRNLFDLTELIKLDLGHNNVHFDAQRGFGRVGDATKLEVLHLDQTDIRKWDGIGKATGLKELSINDVYMDGPMSDEVFELKNIQTLRCQFAGMNGPLSTRIGELVNLERLNLYGNRFTSNIPAEIGNLKKLHILDLSENNFSGPIPATLNGLQKLQRLEIHQSSRDNDGLQGPLPVFDDLPNLNTLRLDSNSLTGPISPQFLSGISDPDRELTIGLSYNMIDGTVPAGLANFSLVNLDLVGNQISAISDALCNKGDWNSGEVGKVGSCDAILCPKNKYNVYGMATSEFDAVCTDCPGAQYMGTSFCDTDSTDYSEKKFLDELFGVTGGPNWDTPNSWTETGVAHCDYEGVTCGEDDSVTQLRLSSFGLSGEVPSEIWTKLPNLAFLAMRNNSATVSFDGIDAATNLEYLDLSHTDVKTLEGISASQSLRSLVFEWNFLDDAIPSDIFDMTQLTNLDFNHNHFSGELQSDIQKLANLQEFACYNCDFMGTIPSELGLLANLEVLDLGKNLLTGYIPTEFGSLLNLKSLALNGQRSGSRISGPLLDFKDNSQLTTLALRENAIAGAIPASFLASVPRTAENVQIDLFENQLTGLVPIELDDFVNMNLYLGDNMITKLVAEFCDEDNDNWMGGTVGDLGCDAILCKKGHYSLTDGRQTSSNSPCEACPFPNDAPYLGSTHCGANERGILMTVYNMLGGKTWINNRGWGSSKPLCSWHGVTCRDDRPTDEERVIELSLEDNNLQSSGDEQQSALVSKLLFQLPYLQSLDLKGNDVRLKLDDVSLATNLERLILSSTGLTSLKGVGSATTLRELHVTDNGLNGTLDDSGILQLTNLELLFISYNHLSGDILSITGLSKLTQLYAYQNQFSSSLPSDIASISNLEQLVLGENMLTGTIPSMPASLVHLSLYKQGSNDKISGDLPDFASHPNLATLDLEGNNIGGSIPETFLSGSTLTDSQVKVLLGSNDITGAVPTSLDDFRQLELGIVGTRITSIPDSLCDGDNGAWMGGAVESIGWTCAAIACPPYTWNDAGRQIDLDTPCIDCPEMNDAYVGNQQCVKLNHEKEILKELFTATRGVFWIKKYGWGSDTIPLCRWDGVICGDGSDTDDEGVTVLDLEKFQLDGDIPTSIYQLPQLNEVNLRYNYDAILSFEGIGSAANLEVMRLSEIIIDSLNGIGQSPKLRRLHLTGCDLWGNFPDEIFDLASTLKQLFVAYNDFSGPLPTKIGKMKHLTDFFAYDNSFAGSIPTEIGNMKSMKNMVLSENLLTGQLPSQISALPNLQLFSVFRRDKEGSKLTGTLPAFASSPQLTDLYLDGNEIGGQIPADFLSSSSNIYLVTLANNKLDGAVPAELGDLPPFQLEMEGNLITSVPDELCESKDMMRGDVGNYGCDAILCGPGTGNYLGRQNSSDTECAPCVGATYWGSTSCGSKKPDGGSEPGLSESDQVSILSLLYNACGGSKWVKNDNWMSSDVSVCKWHGITCNDENSVHSIRLGANNLVGSPPRQLFNLPHLKWLWLHSNPIQFSFENIGNAEKLVELRLDSTRLASVEGLGDAKSLEILDLRFNSLVGAFPTEVLQLENLEVLSLADNDLRGQVPDLAGLAKLKTLRIGSNSFTGSLPSFESSSKLRALDLSQNKLDGSIPSSFLDTVSTDDHVELNLASNRLTGAVPPELDRFRLMTIYLRDNMITNVPTELCDGDNSNWNNGDVGFFSCDAILCPPGTFNKLGRQTNAQTRCTSCEGGSSKLFGQVSCNSARSSGWSLSLMRRSLILSSSVIGIASGLFFIS